MGAACSMARGGGPAARLARPRPPVAPVHPTVNAFSAVLHRGATGCLLHEGGVGVAGAGDQVGMGHHRVEELASGSPLPELGPAGGEGGQRNGVGRDATAVDARLTAVEADPTEVLDGRVHVIGLDGMPRRDVPRRVDPEERGHREEAGVLARAAVVAGVGFAAAADEVVGGGEGQGAVGPAFEVARRVPVAGQPVLDERDVLVFAAVAGTGQGELGGAEPHRLGGAGGEQRRGLDRLQGRTRVHEALWVTANLLDLASRIDEDQVDVVSALDDGSSGHLHDERRGHGESLAGSVRRTRLPVPAIVTPRLLV